MPQQESQPTPPHYTSEQVILIQEEVTKILQKQAIQPVECPSERDFYSNIFLVPKKDGGQRPVINLKALNSFVHKQLCSPRALQDGGHSNPKGSARAGGLANKSRSEGCVLRSSHTPCTPKVPTISASGENLPVHLPPVRPILSPMGVHKTLKPALAILRQRGVRLIAYIDDILLISDSAAQALEHVQALAYLLECLGFTINTEKSMLTPTQNIEFLGALSKLHRHGATTPPTQNKTDSSGVSKDNEDGRVNLSPYTSTSTRENELNSMCNSPCTSLLQKSTDGTLQHSGEACPKLRRISNLNTSQFGRAEMVGHGDVQVEWEDPLQERDRYDHRLRRITAGMGSLLWHPNHKGSVVTEGGNPPHQLFGIAGSHTSSSVICKLQIQIEHPAEDRQHHSSSIYQPSGGDSFKRLGRSDEEPVDVVPGEEHTHHSPTPPRVPEHHCGCRITVTDRQDRLEAVPSAVPQNTANIWPTSCNPPVCSVPSLLQLAARSVCRNNRCISPSMDPHQGICQSTLESGGQNTCPSTVSTSQPGVGSTSVEIPTMVPHTTTHVGGLPQTDNIRNGNNGQQRQLTDAPTTSRMAHLRERYRSQQLSEEATDLMLSSWRTKTNKSYDSLFTKWHRWCSERSSDPFSGPIAQVANFLAYLYKEGYKYSSINAYRSAISSGHGWLHSWPTPPNLQTCKGSFPIQTSITSLHTNLGCSEGTKLS